MNISGSRAGLLPLCQHHARDDIKHPTTQPDNKLATRGTTGHRVIQGHYDNGGPLADIAPMLVALPISDRQYLAETYDRFKESRVSRAPFKSEQAFAFSVRDNSSKALGRLSGHRAYEGLIARSHEIPSTLDLEHFDARSRTVHVGDIKIGEGNEARAELADAQLRFNAMSAARAHNADRAIVTVIHLSPDGVDPRQWEMSRADIDAEAEKIIALTARIPGAEPQPGDHCFSMWCPLRGTCSATVRWQAALVPSDIDAGLMFDPKTPEHYFQAIQAIKALTTMAEWLKAEVDAKVDLLPSQSIDLPDGRRYERCEKTPRKIDLSVSGAEEAIIESGFGDAIEHAVTLGRLAASARAKGHRGAAVESIVNTLVSGLESMGAVKGDVVVSHEIKGKRAKVLPPESGA